MGNDTSNNGQLLYVHAFFRHGERTPSFIFHDISAANKLWTEKIDKSYSSVRLNHKTNAIFINNKIPEKEIFKWPNVAKRLNGTFIAHKKDNWDGTLHLYFT